jgi:hypothetical protein
MKKEVQKYKKLKDKAWNTEQDFDGFENVWNNIETKLDHRSMKHKKEWWKTTAIAASVLLTLSIIYLVITKNDTVNFTQPNTPSVEIVSEEKAKEIIEEKQSEVVFEDVKKDKSSTQNKVLSFESSIDEAKNNSTETKELNENVYKAKSEEIIVDKPEMKKVESAYSNFNQRNQQDVATRNNAFVKRKAFESRSTNMQYFQNTSPIAVDKNVKFEKSDTVKNPLLVVDGKVKQNNLENDAISEQELKELANEYDTEDIIHLKEPLYIINGEEFTEEEVYGKNPTCKYAPLTKEKIKKIKVYTPLEGINKYGDKGKKGVVVITLKK